MIPLLYLKKIGSGMKKALLILTILTSLITYLLFLPYTNKLTTNLANSIDPVFYAWNINHDTVSLLQKGKNMLNTNIFYPEGNTLAFSDTLYGQMIFTVPLQLLTHNVVLTENIYVFLTFPLATIAMFFLSYFLTRNTLASALSGLFYAFSYPRIAQIGHMPMISSQWLPVFVLYLIKYIEHGSWKDFLLTFLFYFLSIASSIYFGIFLIPFAIIAVLVESIRWIQKKSFTIIKKTCRNFLIFAIPMIGLFILILYPYFRLKAEYPGIKRKLEDAARLSANVTDYATILPTSLIAPYKILTTGVNEHPLYPTITVAMLALLGMIVGWKKQKKYIVIFSLTGLCAFMLSFGPYLENLGNLKELHFPMPYYYLYQAFSILQIIRVPARLSIIVVLMLSALSAIGLSHLFKKQNMLILSGFITLIFFIEVWQVNTPSVSLPIDNDIPMVYQWLSKQPDTSIIAELPFRPLASLTTSMEDQLFRPYAEVRDNDGYALETFRIYFSTYHRKRMLNGYSGYFPQVYHDEATILQNFPSKDSIDILERQHVRYVIIHAWQYTDRYMIDIMREAAKLQNIQLIQQFGDDYVYEILKKE